MCASTAAAVTVVSFHPALAFDLDGQNDLITETVASKKPEHTEPEGRRVGNFFVLPAIGEKLVYDDNIFSATEGTVADIRLETTPTLFVQSRLPRHAIDLSLAGKIVSYAENTDQNYENVLGKARGALHFDHAHTLSALVLSSLDHEEIGESTASLAAAEPVPVVKNRASIGFTRDVGRLFGTLSATAESSDFGSVEAKDGSRLNQDERDQKIYSSELRTGYRFSPGYEFVGKLRGLRQINEPDETGDRNATGYEALAGLAFETNPILSWRLIGGYGVREFDRSSLDGIGSYLVEGKVQWLPTDRLKLFATLRREILDDLGATDSGRIDTSVLGRMEYEIKHDLAFKLGAELTGTEFIGSARQDRTGKVNASVEYEYTRNWLFILGYQFQNRDSNDNQFDNNRNRFSVGAKLRF